MKSDKQGCSTCARGQEQYEEYYSAVSRRNMVQYDYRDIGGELFGCVAPTLEKCREKRDKWIEDHGYKNPFN
jgi:hypothetical protein